MDIGVIFPQTEMPPNALAIRTYAQEVERLGLRHIRALDHVVGANTASRPEWKGPYDLHSSIYEPLTLFSYLAGVTEKTRLITGVIILPQRQTVLVAKQAACLDVLCNGRLTLGVGTGWNEVEYEALGMNFVDRGAIYEEQIAVLRALWSQPAVTFDTSWHKITDAGINPLPIQRPIPLWMGGGPRSASANVRTASTVLRRIARLADGWIPMWQPDEHGKQVLRLFHDTCLEFGRDPKTIAIEGTIDLNATHRDNWIPLLNSWRGIGATHVSVNTMGHGLQGCDEHLRRLQEFMSVAAKQAH